MPTASDTMSVIERGDVATAVVEIVATADAEHQHSVAPLVIKHWELAEWPAGLVAQTLFTSTDGKTLLIYSQWSAAAEAAQALRRAHGEARPDWQALGIEPGTPKAYQLYRRVRPAALPDPLPAAGCLPAAFFAMDSRDAAQAWVDGLLDKEEQDEGDERAYPGALAANFHVADDGVFLLSEWASEAEAVAHIKEVIEPLLEYMGQAEAGAGARYAFHASVS